MAARQGRGEIPRWGGGLTVSPCSYPHLQASCLLFSQVNRYVAIASLKVHPKQGSLDLLAPHEEPFVLLPCCFEKPWVVVEKLQQVFISRHRTGKIGPGTKGCRAMAGRGGGLTDPSSHKTKGRLVLGRCLPGIAKWLNSLFFSSPHPSLSPVSGLQPASNAVVPPDLTNGQKWLFLMGVATSAVQDCKTWPYFN